MPIQTSAESALATTLLATINHNLPVMVYIAGAIFMITLLFIKPNRKLILFLIGFVLLAFHFEYVKHIAEGLQEQTRISIESTGYQSAKGTRAMDLFFQDFIPFASFLGGWGMIFLGIASFVLTKKELLFFKRSQEEVEFKKSN